MKTVVTDSPAAAAKFIRDGGIVAFPTETVYGLGADLFKVGAIEKIFEAKRRPADNPLIIHVANREQIELLAAEVTASANKFIDRFFPGPLTIVLYKSARVPATATAGLDTVGIRMPGDTVAREFLYECQTPVAAPSANLSGRPSPTTWQAVLEDLEGRIDCILRGDPTQIGLESTVVDCTGKIPFVLRPGSISIDDLRAVIRETRLIGPKHPDAARSPGTRHQHYSPAASVHLVQRDTVIDDAEYSAYIGLTERRDRFRSKKVCTSIEQYARELFEFFRECDRQGVDAIYCEKVSNDGIGAALMDRVIRASETSSANEH